MDDTRKLYGVESSSVVANHLSLGTKTIPPKIMTSSVWSISISKVLYQRDGSQASSAGHHQSTSALAKKYLTRGDKELKSEISWVHLTRYRAAKSLSHQNEKPGKSETAIMSVLVTDGEDLLFQSEEKRLKASNEQCFQWFAG